MSPAAIAQPGDEIVQSGHMRQDVVAENEIGLPALPHITEDDLKEMGVALDPRRQLLAAIGELALNAVQA